MLNHPSILKSMTKYILLVSLGRSLTLRYISIKIFVYFIIYFMLYPFLKDYCKFPTDFYLHSTIFKYTVDFPLS